MILRSVLGLFLFSGLVHAADSVTTIWFKEPADKFQESLPLGSGRIGAMVFGGVNEERIILNENSLWSGSKQDADRPNAHEFLAEIRNMLLQGRNLEAEKLVNANFICSGSGSNHSTGEVPFGRYQTLGNLRLKFEDPPAPVTGFRRELDLATALARVGYSSGGVGFSREYFTSAPDRVLVVRLRADKPGSLSFSATLDRPERFETKAAPGNELLMTGTLNDGRGGRGVSYAARLRVEVRGGTVQTHVKSIRVRKADEVVLLLAAATDYKGFAGRRLDDPVAATRSDIDQAAGKSFEQLRAAQKSDHERFFNRVQLLLPDTQNSALPTLDRLKGFEKGADDPALAALYFNFGRYLLIGSSRPGGLPANLQGLWAEEIRTPWNADWHLNINAQMNYWPAELCNLGELHEPLHKLTASLVDPGRETARASYNARGWVAHVITNAWGFTSPGEQASWGSSTLGSAWLCHHLWEHYAFSLDEDFLRLSYPILKDAALFYADCLFEEPEHRWLVTGPSNSPENRFLLPDGKKAHVCMGPTIDMQLIRELFGNTSRAASLLGVDKDFQKELDAKAARLAPNQIAPDGRLQEWLVPYPEADPTHRHISHMYGLYPGCEITRRGNPELAEACRKSLDARGDKSTGWALAWRINCWARLGEGDRCERLLRQLLKPTTPEEGKGPNGKMFYDGRGAGSFANLFDSCPPFQIDGNFGGAAGIGEMLLQSSIKPNGKSGEYEIELLPALPKAWPTGSVKGLCARGGFTVGIEWKDGHLALASIHSKAGMPAAVRYGEHTLELGLKTGETVILDGALSRQQRTDSSFDFRFHTRFTK